MIAFNIPGYDSWKLASPYDDDCPDCCGTGLLDCESCCGDGCDECVECSCQEIEEDDDYLYERWRDER